MEFGSPQDAKSERIQARTTRRVKERIERAAAMRGVSLSDFLISTALEEADKTLQSYEQIELSALDSQAFVTALLDPPTPNEELLAARRRYHAEVER